VSHPNTLMLTKKNKNKNKNKKTSRDRKADYLERLPSERGMGDFRDARGTA